MTTISKLATVKTLQRKIVELSIAHESIINSFANALDLREGEAVGHSQQVADLTVELAKSFAYGDADLVHIKHGALLHDIGKMGIPESILQKPDSLDNAEWETIQKHPQYGYDLLSQVIYLHQALDIPYYHHEKWDGSGYPFGIAGEKIPLPARIFAVVDVWDALRSKRTYRSAWTKEKALKHMRNLSGTHFDPRVFEAFLELLRSPYSKQLEQASN